MSIVSPMYIFVVCDDLSYIEINGERVTEDVWQVGWNNLQYFYVEDVTQNDKVIINCINECAPGGLNVSYIWNKCLYTLPNNGMEGIANIINYQVTGAVNGWSTLWDPWIPTLLPWMKNYINMEPTGCSGGPYTYMTVTFNIGNTVNIPFTNNLWCYASVDNAGVVYLNNNPVYNISQPWNVITPFIIPNVNYGDELLIDCTNEGGPGGVTLTYIYQGMITGLPSSLPGFNSVINNLEYTSSNLVDGIYPAITADNLLFNVNGGNMNWLNACYGNCNFQISTFIVGSSVPTLSSLPGLNDFNFAESNEGFSNMITYDEEKYVRNIFIYIVIIIIVILLIYFFLSKLKIKKLKK